MSDFFADQSLGPAAAIVSSTLVVGLAWFFIKKVADRAFDRISQGITSSELKAVLSPILESLGNKVDRMELKATMLQVEKDMNVGLAETRHDIRNEMNLHLSQITEQLTMLRKESNQIGQTVARLAGIMEGAQLSTGPRQ